jgi:hypothetical protein
MTEEWTTEPNRKHWIDPTTRLDCLIVRNRIGALCGYVGVPNTHPWYGMHYDAVDAYCHGGLTFSSKCNAHVRHDANTETVANADVWWLGFDCAHSGDLCPGMPPYLLFLDGIYRNIAYVENECRNLALQIQEAAE